MVGGWTGGVTVEVGWGGLTLECGGDGGLETDGTTGGTTGGVPDGPAGTVTVTVTVVGTQVSGRTGVSVGRTAVEGVTSGV